MAHISIDHADVFEDAARLASQKGLVRFTRFLDPAQAVQADGFLTVDAAFAALDVDGLDAAELAAFFAA